MKLSAIAPAKLNLFLHITGKRDDGYHLLDSVVAFTEFGDELTVEPATQLTLSISGPWAQGLSDGDDNLIIRAAKCLQSYGGDKQGASISLQKHIPIGAGLGGGSSDAATAAIMLNELWQMKLSRTELAELLKPLGADMAVCVMQTPQRMQGIGDIVSPLTLTRSYHLLLVNPMMMVSTPDVYKAYKPAFRHALPSFEENKLADYHNDLTDAAIAICPDIRDSLDALHDTSQVQLVRMCGSGATCFALYETDEKSAAAAEKIRAAHPQWWVQTSRI